jgi:hypothetical protein
MSTPNALDSQILQNSQRRVIIFYKVCLDVSKYFPLCCAKLKIQSNFLSLKGCLSDDSKEYIAYAIYYISVLFIHAYA